jgi:hypothetical protein
MSRTELTPEAEEWDFEKARAKLAPKLDGRKSARKNRQKRLSESVDGRSLRATGRTEHLNFKAKPEINAARCLANSPFVGPKRRARDLPPHGEP